MTVPEMRVFAVAEHHHARALSIIDRGEDEGALVDELIAMAEAFALVAERIQARRRQGVSA